jgi:N,N-dimethylformamidase
MTTELIGYADTLSVSPGQTVGFHISTDFPEYSVSIVRLTRGERSGRGFREEEVDAIPARRGRKQATHPGSYAIVEDHLAIHGLRSFTVQMWIFPTTPEKRGEQGLLSRWSGASGFALVIGSNGDLGIWLGDETSVERIYSGKRLRSRAWCFVCACVDAQARTVVLKQTSLTKFALEESSSVSVHTVRSTGPYDSRSPLLIAATNLAQNSTSRAAVVGLYNGKIDRPALFGRALSPAEIELLEQAENPSEVGGPDLIGAWDFSIGISTTRIVDIGRHGLNGRVVNMPTRAVTDHFWNGELHDHKHAPSQYSAIHFHDDDLEDAGWETDFEWQAPAGARSGFYAARLSHGAAEDHVPFFVRPESGRPNASAVVIAPTLTYLAYANERLTSRQRYEKVFKERSMRSEPLDEYLLSHPELAMSLYNLHSDGSGCCYSSYLRPITNMRPKYRHWLTDGPRHLGADLNLIDWLEMKRVRYDVVTDHDLHAEGKPLLDSYKVVITGTHPEYWTAQMLTALREYLNDGGHLMYLGGNGFYWVTAIDQERPHAMEVRRGNCGTRTWNSEPGENYLSSTGELCGLWRHRGVSPNMIAGVGMTAMGYDAPTPGYQRQGGSFDKRAKFIFEGIGAHETIGAFGSILGGAAGDEIDRLDYSLGSPPNAMLLATATGYSKLYMPAIEDFTMLSPLTVATQEANLRADIVYFETPKGGAVFSVGAITWCGSLAHNDYDNNVSRITENVLKKFAGGSL